MEFKQLQSLSAVVQYGSFTKAAEKLFLSQPTISTHIRQLAFPLVQSAAVRNLYLVCRRDLPRNRQVEAFVQFMKMHYAEDLSAAAAL